MDSAARTPERHSEPLLLRVDEATARLVSLKSAKRLYAWISDGVIPPAAVLRVGSAIFIRRLALERWLGDGQGAVGGATKRR